MEKNRTPEEILIQLNEQLDYEAEKIKKRIERRIEAFIYDQDHKFYSSKIEKKLEHPFEPLLPIINGIFKHFFGLEVKTIRRIK